MKVAVCDLPDDEASFDDAWDRLARRLSATPVDLLVLPELAGVAAFWTRPDFDQAVWNRAVAKHAQFAAQLRRLSARRIVGTVAETLDGRRLNRSFLWTAAEGLIPSRAKAWLPEEEGAWEATWFDRGDPRVRALEHEGLRFATLVCTEIIVSGAPRALGHSGVQLIAAPRATSGHPRWEVATRMAAIAAGAYVLTSNRHGGRFGGGGWIVGPDGEELARTEDAGLLVVAEIDLARADGAKRSYPRNVVDPLPQLQEFS